MSTEDILAELKTSYINGFRSQTDEIESLILKLEKETESTQAFEELFRKVHSIKGSAGTFGFSILSSICHQMEDFLTDCNKTQAFGQKTINTLLAYLDLLVEARQGIMNNSVDYHAIEMRLQDIGDHRTSALKKCLCVGLNKTFHRKIIEETAKTLNIQCSYVENGLTAMERLLHEHFDILITARENKDLNGIAMIAALRLNKRKNVTIESILVTSNPHLGVPTELQPHHIIAKDKDFPTNLHNTLTTIIN